MSLADFGCKRIAATSRYDARPQYWRVPRVLAVYVGSLVFGALLIRRLAVRRRPRRRHARRPARRRGHGSGDGHDQNQASAWLSLFGLRFWSFGTVFFGRPAPSCTCSAGPRWPSLAPFIAAAVGVAAGLGASIDVPRAVARDRRAAAWRRRAGRSRGDACCCRSRAGSAARCASRIPAAATSIWSPSRTTRRARRRRPRC